MTLSVGQRVTLLRIDDCLAMTHRYELEVRSLYGPERVGYQGRKERLAVVRQRGKRKDQFLDLEDDDIVLDGWGLPFITDTESSGIMAGNACFNLIGEPEVIRQYVEGRGGDPGHRRGQGQDHRRPQCPDQLHRRRAGAAVPGDSDGACSGEPVERLRMSADTRLTPVDTRGQVFLGLAGVRKNAETPGNPGFSYVVLLYESGALPLS